MAGATAGAQGLASEELTRELFRGLSSGQVALFYLSTAVVLVLVARGVLQRVQKYRRGTPVGLRHSWGRVARALRLITANLTVGRRHLVVGTVHFLAMWGFVVLFIGTVILTVEDHTPLHFWYGSFYEWYSLTLDVFGVLFLAGLAVLAVRRGTGPPALSEARPSALGERPDRRSRYGWENRLFLALLFALGLTGFWIEGLRMHADQPGWEAVWSPVGYLTAIGLGELGLSQAGADTAYGASWWLHSILALGLVALLPFTKLRHTVADAINLYCSPRAAEDPAPFGALSPVPAEAERAGYGVISDFRWKDLLDHDACIRCGRCEAACPATAAGRPLSPKQLMLDLGEHATAALQPHLFALTASVDRARAKEPVPGGVIAAETLWACTTCGACVEVCPVGIDQLGQIVEMRRKLIEEGSVDRHVQEGLMSVFEEGNALGEPGPARGDWARQLEPPVADARREAVEVLWYVGDVMSFDRRAQRAARALATVLREAGLHFGILYDDEVNDGNDLRRIGEEGLFEMMAGRNVERWSALDFRRIVTADPHALNAIRHDYRLLGGRWEVVHHSELVRELMASGALVPQQGLRGTRVTYHDPCYLARYNDGVDAPRTVLAALGVELAEMPRCGRDTFCCGAGGGGFFRDFPEETERPSEQRIREAMGLDPPPELFVVACPMDAVMYEDAVKTTGYADRLQVVELSELVERSLPGARAGREEGGAA